MNSSRLIFQTASAFVWVTSFTENFDMNETMREYMMSPALYWCGLLWSCMQSLLIACEQCVPYILVFGSVDGQMRCTSECPLPRRCLGQSDLSIFSHFYILQLEPSCIAATWIVVLLLVTPPHIAYHRSVDHTIGFHLWKIIGGLKFRKSLA